MMSEKMFGTKVDDVDSSIINITRDGEDFAWFLSDVITDKQVEKVVDLLNELSEENEELRRLFEEMKQPITINLREEDEKELRKLLGLIDDE